MKCAINTRVAVMVLLTISLASCHKKNAFDDLTFTDPPNPDIPFNINSINDTYGDVAPFAYYYMWGSYNVHDPSIIKAGDYFYCYSTDAAYGVAVRPGIMVRKSKDLVKWEFVGWVFNSLPAMGSQYITSNGGVPNNSLWAPYIMKVGTEYRLYYSLASSAFRVSCIGLATSTSPEGPWVEKGLAVTSVTNGAGTNAIDPTVVVTPAGEHYMVYGSAWDGLFELKLNPATGLAATAGDRGTRKVRRGKTGTQYNGNLEGPEIIYNAQTNMYYLFVAYDWLSTKYNVRVYRSTSPTGPFLDWAGANVDDQSDHGPMILAPYKFAGHGGWAGVSHCSVFQENGQYFMAHQGRPGVDLNYMDLHVRKMFWTADGWPMVSPERYANVANTAITPTEMAGDYEQIVQGYTTVPGYGNEQTNPNYNDAFVTTLNANGRINGDANNTWTYNAPSLELRWAGGLFVDKFIVSRERDWENKIKSTIVATGLNGGGLSIWLKKKQ